MKLIDKKGKIFGLINAIDLCIIVVVVVLIAGAVYKFKFMDKTSNTAAMQNVTYTVKIEKISIAKTMSHRLLFFYSDKDRKDYEKKKVFCNLTNLRCFT